MKYLIKLATVINEGSSEILDVLIENERIAKIAKDISDDSAEVINAEGLWLIPGAIDDQVHFREPGLTHKGEIYTEAKAAVAGGITSYMEMPNTVPNVFTQALLEDKYQRAAEVSLANYTFFMGTSNDNLEEVLRTNTRNVCGVKIFMGSSTGNMLVDNPSTLESIFAQFSGLIATHCEDEMTIKRNQASFKEKYGDNIDITMHAQIRSEEACYLSSSFAVSLAKKHNTRLHILHISTEKETHLFESGIPLEDKLITSEACIHHLWFSDEDYPQKGNFIKWNPAVKKSSDRAGIWKALLDGRIDVIATDHAPHTFDEKTQAYSLAPSGGPLVQHAVQAIVDKVFEGQITKEMMVQKMSHNPAILFRIEDRGFIREGYYADLVLVDPNKKMEVNKSNILYKCNWSPFEGHTFRSSINTTFVNGHKVYHKGVFDETSRGKRLLFNR
ncbi:MAG: dihydroorotase [Sphingobacteriales bacterium]|nr:dihydroorotase [Sphingobacteriales bacterium]